jgi:hypothetical protein
LFWSYEIYDQFSYIYDILVLLTILVSLRSMFNRKTTITKLIMPSDRGLSDEAIHELGDKVI